MILYLIIRIGLYSLKNIKMLKKILDFIYSFILKLYSYVFLVPFLEASISQIFIQENLFLSWCSFFSTLLISVILSAHEFSYSFVLKDFLSKRDSDKNHLEVLIIIVYCILFAGKISSSFSLGTHFVLTFIQIITFIHFLSFYDNQI